MKLPTIKGKNVILRPLSIKDAKNYYKWLGDFEILKLINTPSPSFKSEIKYIKEAQKDKTKAQFSIDTSEGAHIGTVSLSKINYYAKRAEYGIFIGDKRYWGQGYGTEAGKLIIKFGFNKLKLNRIFLKLVAYNIRGEKSYKKIGFKKEGIQRDHIYSGGYYHDQILMGMLKSDYQKLKNNYKTLKI